MNIILFNGPPSSGKDTAAMHLYRNRHETSSPIWHSCRFDRMSMPNKLAFAATLGGSVNEFGINQLWEPIKEEPLQLLNGRSYRNWQQDFSEKFMKPCYGESIFARLFVDRWSHRRLDDRLTLLVPDCGFAVEAQHLKQYMSGARIAVVRIHRPGYDFRKDTRSYLTDGDLKGFDPALIIDVQNNDTEARFCSLIDDITRDIVGERK